ncbi:MAG: DUF2975 domain-containing protein [Verrucomicrobia bacterium]|nr:DUF2975 domain-containing protein [Verrucomicrobiota bacterium]
MNNQLKIRYLCRILRYICLLGIIIVPLLNAFYWIHDGFQIVSFKKTHWFLQFADAPFTAIDELPNWLKFTGFLVDLIPYIFFFLMLLILMKLLRLYEKLEFFSKNNIRYIRQIGCILVIGQIIHPFYIALHSFILTLSSPPGQRVVIIAYGPNQIKTLFLAFIIFLAAYIMEVGRHYEDEYSSTV